jgi:hypothetical protein
MSYICPADEKNREYKRERRWREERKEERE